jgi:uncharacterized protein YjgD (DUF1641 family)
MTHEEVILKKLEGIEATLADLQPLIKFGRSVKELRDDLIPLQNKGVQLLIEELQEVEAGFQLEDLLLLIKQMMRSTRSFNFLLRQLNSMVDFVQDMEPLLRSAVPQMIEHLDDLERKGVFRIIKSMMDVRAKIASAYTPEDIEQIGDGLVSLLALTKKLSEPKTIDFLDRLASVPEHADFQNARKIGPFGLASAAFNSDVKQGLGVLIELTKAMGHLKKNGASDFSGGDAPAKAPSVIPEQTI